MYNSQRIDASSVNSIFDPAAFINAVSVDVPDAGVVTVY
jgi:hypothetical protein